ncbi:hypothetical protein HDU85_003859 [Gaertneriomyces sp. JEL0708]|nr:hypothetical protein HDU85_003859 [Gaertneriomyces sp. JEL0708]
MIFHFSADQLEVAYQSMKTTTVAITDFQMTMKWPRVQPPGNGLARGRSMTPENAASTSTVLVTPYKPVGSMQRTLAVGTLDPTTAWTPSMQKLVEDLGGAFLSAEGSVHVSLCEVVIANQSSWPQDKQHTRFLAYAIDHFMNYATLTARAPIVQHQWERKYVVEHLSRMFIALERIWGVGDSRYIELASTTVSHVSFNGLSRAETGTDTGSVVSYATSGTRARAASMSKHDVVVASVDFPSDVLLVEVSGAPDQNQATKHPLEDADKLENEGKKLLSAKLMAYTRLPASDVCPKIEVLTMQVIRPRMTLLSYRLVRKGCIQVQELYSCMVAFSQNAVGDIKRHLIMGWLMQLRLQELADAESAIAMLADAPPGVETVRDWLSVLE